LLGFVGPEGLSPGAATSDPLSSGITVIAVFSQAIIPAEMTLISVNLINDFEAPIIKAYPVIGDLKQKLYEQGAIYASMTGSGSSIFGLFPKEQKPTNKMFGTEFRIDII
jgi:4-diphosphocytidyl-2C-methyl-D-erythritol kinase